MKNTEEISNLTYLFLYTSVGPVHTSNLSISISISIFILIIKEKKLSSLHLLNKFSPHPWPTWMDHLEDKSILAHLEGPHVDECLHLFVLDTFLAFCLGLFPRILDSSTRTQKRKIHSSPCIAQT